MALYDGSGTALGTSAASLLGSVISHLGVEFPGTSTMVGSGGTNYLSTLQVQGSSLLLWDTQEASGTASGTSTASLSAVRVRNARGVARGTSSLTYSTLLPIRGQSFMAAHFEVQRPQLKGITLGPKTFRWLQLWQRGDLSIFLCNPSGGIIVPELIVYSLIYIRPDGSRKYIQPLHRVPVRGAQPGEFYVVGLAGQGGQPGSWAIEWKVQRSSSEPLQTIEMLFCVLDGVLARDPNDLTDRKVKFGWN